MNSIGKFKALIVDEPYCEYILSGKKTWDMRSSKTTIRGRVGVIKKGSGTVVGFVDVIDCLGPLSEHQMLDTIDKHMLDTNDILNPKKQKWRFAWVLEKAHRLEVPIKYTHPTGAVIWVNLDGKDFEEMRYE